MLKVVGLILFVALGLTHSAPSLAKVSTSVQMELEAKGTVDIIINMREKTSTVLAPIKSQSFATKGARVQSVATNLQALARLSQKPVLSFLSTQPNEVKSFWIANQIYVKAANSQLIKILASMPEIESIIPDKVNLAPLPQGASVTTVDNSTIQWGVERVAAPAVWEQGFTGEGVVVGILDTGVRHTHRVLSSNYRQEKGWYDASPTNSQTPVDIGGHGTHVMGSIVGTDGVGVAPGAKWIACSTSMTFGLLHEYQACGQFLLCPHNPDGSDPDCNAFAHIVSHSWGFYTDEDHKFMNPSIEAWNAAGIFVVWANGNERRNGCSSARYPAATGYDIFTVGATNISEHLAKFSSLGPGVWSGQGHVKPNIAAPGEDIISASGYSDEDLVRNSGTSMAAPHVAGVIALLISDGREHSYEEISNAIFGSAEHTLAETGMNCGDIPENKYPNNAVGHGLINARDALNRLKANRMSTLCGKSFDRVFDFNKNSRDKH